MEDTAAFVETLVKRTAEYSKVSYALIKLKTVEKTSDLVSTAIPYVILGFLMAAFLVFLSLGMASLLGGMLGHLYLGMFLVATFYGVVGVSIYVFLGKWLKAMLSDFIVNLILKP